MQMLTNKKKKTYQKPLNAEDNQLFTKKCTKLRTAPH